MKGWLVKGILLLIIIGGVSAYLMYNKSHKDLKSSDADSVMTAAELVKLYDADEVIADAKFLDKTIEIQGTIVEITDSGLLIDGDHEMIGVTCEFENMADISELKVNESVKVRGICTGKLMDVVLSRCILIK